MPIKLGLGSTYDDDDLGTIIRIIILIGYIWKSIYIEDYGRINQKSTILCNRGTFIDLDLSRGTVGPLKPLFFFSHNFSFLLSF